MVKLLLCALLLLSYFAGKTQKDSLRFTLTIEVKWLETNTPLKDYTVIVTGTNNTKLEYVTNGSGVVHVDSAFIQPECIYTIEVYNPREKNPVSLKAQITTVGINKSQEYYKIFKLRTIYIGQ